MYPNNSKGKKCPTQNTVDFSNFKVCAGVGWGGHLCVPRRGDIGGPLVHPLWRAGHISKLQNSLIPVSEELTDFNS